MGVAAAAVCVLFVVLAVTPALAAGDEGGCESALQRKDTYSNRQFHATLPPLVGKRLVVLQPWCTRSRIAQYSYMWERLEALYELQFTANPSLVWNIMMPCNTDYYAAQREFAAVAPLPRNKLAAVVDGGDLLNHKSRLQQTLEHHGLSDVMPRAWSRRELVSWRRTRNATTSSTRYVLKSLKHRSAGLKLVSGLAQAKREMQQSSRYLVAQEVVEPPFTDENGHATSLRVYLLLTCQQGRLRGFVHDEVRVKYAPIPYSREDGLRALATISTPETKRLYAERGLAITLLQLCKTTKRCIAAEVMALTQTLLARVIATLGSSCYLCAGEAADGLAFQLFGVDVIVDAEGRNAWVLEMNKGPDLTYAPDVVYSAIKQRVVADTYCLVGLGCDSVRQHAFTQLGL